MTNIDIQGKTHPDLPGLQYCAQIIKPSADEVNPAIKYLKIKKRQAIATDGNRIHLTELAEDYEDGLYHIVKKTASRLICIPAPENEQDVDYPHYLDILDILKPGLIAHFEKAHEYCSTLADILRALPANNSINPKFVEQAMGWDGFTVYVYDNERPVIFDGGQVQAAVALWKHTYHMSAGA